MPTVEAMMLGGPVNTSDFLASAEYIQEGVTVNRFPIGDDRRLAELIQWHIAHPKQSRQIGLAGQAFAREHYQPEKVAALHDSLYRQPLTS
jgi:glycosyltransferase involved in cell wall biosynthesis